MRLIQAFAAFFNHYDLLLTPCVPIAPFAAGHGINTPDATAYPEWYDGPRIPGYSMRRSCRLLLSLEPGYGGLPQAVQLAATHFREDIVLRAGAVLGNHAGPASRGCAVALCGRSQNDGRMCQIASIAGE